MPPGAADQNVEGIDWIVENKKIETAIFAGGCFWCMTKPFDQMPGIISVRSGYTGGDVENPTYEQVKSGTTGHTEAVKIVFDKTIISYEELLEIYWHQTDPTDAAGQFQDRGSNYRPVIFVKNETQRQAAELSLKNLIASERFKKPIVTRIESAVLFMKRKKSTSSFTKKIQREWNLRNRREENSLLKKTGEFERIRNG